MVHTVNQKGSKYYEQSYCYSAKMSMYSWSSSEGETMGSISGHANLGSQI